MKFLLTVSALLIVAALLTAASAPTVVSYVNHDKMSAMFAKGGAVIEDHGLRVLAQRRGAGEAELHKKTNHVFIIVEGDATFVTGGTLVGAKETEADQVRAASVQGGTTHHLTKGDVITVPANTPHWWKEVSSKTIAYYGVNTEN